MLKELEKILSRVRKPARYSGGEFAQVIKDRSSVELRVAFCFPDVYEVGMSHLGMKILYGLYNSVDYCWCERCFAPWPDMEAELRAARLPLYALESGDGLGEFDIIAFTLQYELSFTNVLNMLDLAGIPVHAAEREGLRNLVIAGGCCTANPEPLADFVDVFVIGEGEEVSLELFDLYRTAKRENWEKRRFLVAVAEIGGCYVPALYTPHYDEKGNFTGITPSDGAPERIVKRIVKDLDHAYYPQSPVVPSTEVVHDRVMLEVMRGCIRGCRFCQAGHTFRPIREKSPETLIRQGITQAENTGYDEISLTSLSTTDYRRLDELCDGLIDWCEKRHISLALPSQRADKFSVELAQRLEKVRRTGLTFAPEAGTQRLRDVINKNLREEDLYNACGLAFANGWNSVKLYYMMGLPTETLEDLDGIAKIARGVVDVWRKTSNNRARGVKVTASVACFVPKPGTPFQWEPMDTVEQLREKQEYMKGIMRIKNVDFHWHDPVTSHLEGVFARGDRRLCAVIYDAWRRGCRFDGWDDQLRMDLWYEAFAACGVDMAYYANRSRSFDEALPWEHIYNGVTREHLMMENMRAHSGLASEDCRAGCAGCGALELLEGGICDV